MNIDAIIQKIQDDAQQYGAQTLEDAREKAAQLCARAEAERARNREAVQNDAHAEAGEVRNRMLRMAALDARKEMLAVKRELIDQAFAKALEAMRAMQSEQAQGFHIRLLLEVALGTEKLEIAEGDEPLFDAAFFTKANAAMEKVGRTGALTLSPNRRALGGGFVLEQEGMEINCTYESVLRTRRAGLEAEVAAALFA